MKTSREVMEDIDKLVKFSAQDPDALIIGLSNYVVDRQQEALSVGQSSAPGKTFEMHTRDAYARAALTGLLADQGGEISRDSARETIVAEAFLIADICIAERQKEMAA